MNALLLVAGQVLVLATAPLASAAETTLDHKAILQTLTGAVVEGANWKQSFDRGGATTYEAEGKRQTGRWDVQGDQYCSMWPPSDRWSCYAVTEEVGADATTIIWISADGSRESGHLVQKGQ
jgi:hypothetical protein